MARMSTFLVHYRVGDIVDIKANSSEQKGMVRPSSYRSKSTDVLRN